MRTELLLAGFGGQGVLFVGDLVTRSAMAQGLHTTYMPTYGVAMRGGTANCVVIMSDEPIGSPVMDEPDAAVILNQQSFDKFQPSLKKGGLIVTNSTLVSKDTFTRSDTLRLVMVDATKIARKITGREQAANMAALGAYLAVGGILSYDVVDATLRANLHPSKQALLEPNLETIRAGMEAAK
ncbi:MAG: 2-oxoacid:acceptor oxidoreductase family protein [Candidatus Hydrogenedentes bacterium]|nr:2-oxoacid:acceptor oxidoreductase family protein [Candidatus Hydrogenedentota bacterium]